MRLIQKIVCWSWGLMGFGACSPSGNVPVYKDPSWDIDKRVEDLLGRMTIEEKASQLCSRYDHFTSSDIMNGDEMDLFFQSMPGMLQPDKMDLDSNVLVRNAIQKYALEKTRLGIPMLFVDEALHGPAKGQATSFPQAVAMGCTWNPELIEDVFRVTAHELRSRGTHFVLSPVVDVAREPRWGRGEECYGEDPYLAGKMGAAAIRGLQGSADGTIAENHVGATLKHFVGHGQKEGGRNKAPANIAPRILRDLHIEPFRIAVRESSPRGIMPSYNEVDGIPMHMNTLMLQGLLREEFGFDGMMVSDYQGVKEIRELHKISPDDKTSALLAFKAGVEFDLPDGACFSYLPELVKEGKVSEKELDKAVAKILRLKFELGLFESPYVDVEEARKVSKNKEHKELARKVAQESIVLLKNEQNILPLDPEKYKRIAVVGPNANDTRIGEYSGIPYYKVTVLEGMRKRFGEQNVVYSEGCKITNNHTADSRETWFKPIDENTFPAEAENMKRIEKAVRIARQADIVVLVIGENEMLCREAFGPSSTGDNSILDLFSQQNELFDALYATGKPVIVCLMHGRPLTINNVAAKADAILDLWYAGQETGNAVADIISGDVNPSGKLTMTYPKSVGQLPVHYNRKPTSARNYVKEPFGWIYPFGYGLSYAAFEYDNLQLSSKSMKADGKVTLSCDITNTGKVGGYETAQLYIHDELATVTRPGKELKGFRKIYLNAGERKRVEFEIDASVLEFWNVENKYVVEPGEFTLMIGRSSEDICLRDTLCVE